MAWDESGAGRSADVRAGFSLADYAHALAAVIDDAGLGPAHVCGLSWDGTVVVELYRRRARARRDARAGDTYAGWKASLPAEEVRARIDNAREMLTAPAGFDPCC